jgi:hypothetical protein
MLTSACFFWNLAIVNEANRDGSTEAAVRCAVGSSRQQQYLYVIELNFYLDG